jgi:hypothetical protein
MSSRVSWPRLCTSAAARAAGAARPRSRGTVCHAAGQIGPPEPSAGPASGGSGPGADPSVRAGLVGAHAGVGGGRVTSCTSSIVPAFSQCHRKRSAAVRSRRLDTMARCFVSPPPFRPSPSPRKAARASGTTIAPQKTLQDDMTLSRRGAETACRAVPAASPRPRERTQGGLGRAQPPASTPRLPPTSPCRGHPTRSGESTQLQSWGTFDHLAAPRPRARNQGATRCAVACRARSFSRSASRVPGTTSRIALEHADVR